ncbi:MAG: esterase [Prevotella sp.]|nr:esterase [Prevotella sp.]
MHYELLRGKRILYVHGFGSSAQSGTVSRIRQTFPEAEVLAYDLPIHPEEAMALLREKCAEQHPDLIIGTSMGGMYAEMLYGYDRILINPAFQIADTMHEHGMTGKQQFFSPREDGVQEFYVDKPLVKEYKLMSEQCFAGVTAEEQQRVFGLFGDKDPLVHTYDLFRQHYTQAIRFHGEHRMDDHSFMNGVVPVIRWIDDRQEGRERPIVYIAIEALKDSWGKPASSMRKAFLQLIEQYNVYVVCPAPTNDHAYITQAQDWIEEHLSTPAHDHVVFTNQRHLLYGDYLIDPAPAKDFMGAQIEFGSDEFKTWEEVITYFERLGGQ